MPAGVVAYGPAMTDDPHSRGGPPTYVQPGTTAPTHAERVRTLLAASGDGVLATAAVDHDGTPFGSIVTFGLDGDATPLILMSTMAEHARNLDADPRGSLLVTAGGEGAGRLAAERVTLLGRVEPVSDPAALDTYLAAHPDAFWARFPDFGVRALRVEAVRYVRGFGEMSWVDADAVATAEPDPVAPAEARIVAHMNADHADALEEMVAAFLEVPAEVTAVEQLTCDRYGFEVRLTLAESGGDVAFGRIGFPTPLQAADEAREAMVALVRQARS